MVDSKDYKEFKEACNSEILAMATNDKLVQTSMYWMNLANEARYSYHFEWLGRPIIQYPQDLIAIQEIVWDTKPDLIIETGIAHGGSLIFSASLLALLDLSDSQDSLKVANPKRRVIGVDVDIRPHNRLALESHFLSDRIDLIQGSSTDPNVLEILTSMSSEFRRIMVILDSNHSEEHVLAELLAYSKFVTRDCYLVVFDTIVEFLEMPSSSNRPWGKQNNPWTAVEKFLQTNQGFIIDHNIHNKLLISVAPNGYLRKI